MTHDGSVQKLVAKEMQRHEIGRLAAEEVLRTRCNPILTISRDDYCGADTIAQEMAERLGWKLYDRDLVTRIAADRHAHASSFERLDEQAFDYLHEWCNEVFVPDYKGQAAYMRGLVNVILGIVKEGKAVLLGRGANFLIPAPRRFAVRFTAPLAWRVANHVRLARVDERTARREVEAEDRRRTEFVRHNFGRDPRDPAHYDLVVNMEHISLGTAQRLVIQGLRERFETDEPGESGGAPK